MLKIYKTIISSGDECFMEYIPAKDKSQVIDVYGGNGEFEKIEEVDYPIYLDVLERTLKEAGYGRAERDIIIRTLRQSIPTKE